ncbi:MAG: hypothetical protein UW03_C0003G0036 [Candidatus Peregrinibacteria bacterium GW2011_GWA2_43_8]|nr:MAG: hypothetical protein UW03_C0003G0036 [Candidatus Peregrinibacteria bacterium GW2011_GWA2_43_8]
MQVLKQKKGFTLIELLVVISIIGILATIVIADYNGEIKRNRVRVAGETLYGELQYMRTMVSSGSSDGVTGDLYCWGIALSESEFEKIYIKYVDGIGCDYSALTVDKEIYLGSGISAGFDDGFSGGYVFFVPPFADMYVFDENFSDLTASLSGLNVVLSGGGTDLQRIVSFDFLTDNFALNE